MKKEIFVTGIGVMIFSLITSVMILFSEDKWYLIGSVIAFIFGAVVAQIAWSSGRVLVKYERKVIDNEVYYVCPKCDDKIPVSHACSMEKEGDYSCKKGCSRWKEDVKSVEATSYR
jgi:hypothetical protein